MDNDIKVDDPVTIIGYPDRTHRVIAIDGDWAWVRPMDALSTRTSRPLEALVKVPPPPTVAEVAARAEYEHERVKQFYGTHEDWRIARMRAALQAIGVDPDVPYQEGDINR